MDEGSLDVFWDSVYRGMALFVQPKKEEQMRKEKEMMNDHDPVELPTVSIEMAENGFVVIYDMPRHLLPNPALENVENIFASVKSAEGGMEGVSPENIFKVFSDVIGKMKKPSKPLRKAREIYVFQSLDSALKFVRETFESLKPKDEEKS